MARKKKGLNRHQKAVFKQAAQFLCPCHVRRRIDEVWEALYRMLEDSGVLVRRAAWNPIGTSRGIGGPNWVADRPVAPVKPGNAGGGKWPDFGHAWERNKGLESGASL